MGRKIPLKCRDFKRKSRLVLMNSPLKNSPPDFQGLPNITLRQLEIFCRVCHEGSYANAALELRSTRANIKRVCDEFGREVGRPLFVEGPERTLQPTAFARGLLGQVSPLSRGLRRLDEGVTCLHKKGRILRFAAAGTFFKGGLFSEFLGRLQISDSFRPCFLRIETKRFRTALLNAECDVYFGVGIVASDRLDHVNLGPIPWKIETGPRYRGELPAKPADLPRGKWWIGGIGETEANARTLDSFHTAGAKGGRILAGDADIQPADDEVLFTHDSHAAHPSCPDAAWPALQFSAVLRKHHPYSELMPRLMGASIS